jgi:hypothetical protein
MGDSAGLTANCQPHSTRSGAIGPILAEKRVRENGPDSAVEIAKSGPWKWLRGRDLNPRPLGYEPVVDKVLSED